MRSLYATMTQIRMEIAIGSGLDLLKGCLIGLRYSVVRRQFRNTDGSKMETKLLDYQTQQAKLLPLMSIGYAILFSACSIYKRLVSA